MNDPQTVKISNADPSAVGLFGLAIVTLVASSQKLGWTQDVSMVVPWAIFLGSFAQLFACVNDSKRGNLFGTTAFAGYGLFWLGVAMSWMVKMGALGPEMAAAADSAQLGFAFLGYLVFTLYMTVAATQTNKVLLIIFILIDFLFLGLTFSTFGVMHEFFHLMAAVSELLIAIMSFYGSAAIVINAGFKKTILPLGSPIKFK